MDTASHGFWTYIIWHSLPFPGLAVLAGVLPDVLAFAPGFTYGFLHPKMFRRGPEAWERQPKWIRNWAERTYRFTHSLIISAMVIGAVYMMYGFQWWILAWPLHILIDIPTHSKKFFPTPFLWPVSEYRFNGISWANKWFMAADLSLLIIVYALVLL